IEAAARRRARWARLDEAAIESGEQALEFSNAALCDGRAQITVDIVEHGARAVPFGLRPIGAADEPLGQHLEPLDGVAGRAPWAVAAEASRARPIPGLAQDSRQRIEAETEIVGERADERGVLALAAAARQARERDQQIGELLATWRNAEDMQAVADLQLL